MSLKPRLAAGEHALGLLLAYDAPWLVEVAALAGCQFILLDLEHEAIGDEAVVGLIRTADAAGIPLLVRMPLGDRVVPFLSAGASGIQVPHLRDRRHAEEIVEATRFRPLGRRTYYTQTRGARYGVGIEERSWLRQANEELLVIAMLEDRHVLEQLDDILEVEGIDGFHIGTLDLADSLGSPPAETLERVVADAIRRCRAADRFVGVGVLTPSNLGSIEHRRRQGVQLFPVASAWMLTHAVTTFFGTARELLETAVPGGRGPATE